MTEEKKNRKQEFHKIARKEGRREPRQKGMEEEKKDTREEETNHISQEGRKADKTMTSLLLDGKCSNKII